MTQSIIDFPLLVPAVTGTRTSHSRRPHRVERPELSSLQISFKCSVHQIHLVSLFFRILHFDVNCRNRKIPWYSLSVVLAEERIDVESRRIHSTLHGHLLSAHSSQPILRCNLFHARKLQWHEQQSTGVQDCLHFDKGERLQTASRTKVILWLKQHCYVLQASECLFPIRVGRVTMQACHRECLDTHF